MRIEVQPGSLRFGVLRAGGVYRMPVFLKNTDVDVVRFTVKPLEEPFLKLWYAHAPLAPGMNVKIMVEIIAHGPAKIDTFLDLRVKSHIAKVPIQANIMPTAEYDRLELETVRLHGRKIAKKGVEIVADEQYAKKALGGGYVATIGHLSGPMSLDF